MVSRLAASYNRYYAARPVLTMMVTNAFLGAIADTTAQSITAIRLRAVHQPGGVDVTDTIAREIHDLDTTNPLVAKELIPHSNLLPPPFDMVRLARFTAFGFFTAPLLFKWFQFLGRVFPLKKGAGLGQAVKRMVFDQTVFAPFGVVWFFTFMTVVEGGGREVLENKLRGLYWPTLKANYFLWPAAQIINFRLMPVMLQLPFVSSLGIAWNAYLSLSNVSPEAAQPIMKSN